MKDELRGIKGVLFDLDDTLYDMGGRHDIARRAVAQFLADRLSALPEVAENVFREGRDATQKSLHGQGSAFSRLLYIQKGIERLTGRTQIAVSLEAEKVFWDAFISGIRLREGVMDLILYLRSRGIKIAVVTNMIAQPQMKKMLELGLDGLCDVLVSSEEAGENKPGAKPFLLALEKLKLTPADVVMVGDDYEADMIGASNLGMRAVYLLTGRNPEPKNSDIEVARSFAEIKTMFN